MMALAALCFVWAGMVLGISFLETPVKFTAPSVTLPIGLDVGRHVFGVFNKVEIGLAVLACGLMIFARAERTLCLPVIAVVLIVALQTMWLPPLLDARVELILSGQTPSPTRHHIIYIVLESLKLICLIVAGVLALQVLKHASSIT